MGLDDLTKGIIGKSVKVLTVAGLLTSAQANAQEEDRHKPKEQPPIELGIPLPEKYFKIDEFVAATEGTSEERKKLAEEVFAHVLQHGTREYGNIEKVFPLILAGEAVGIRVIVFPGDHKEMRVLIFTDHHTTPVALVDVGITGTPSEHQLPVDEKGIRRPQGILIKGEHPLANRVYLGILRQLMSKF